jgi:4-amino-4-deoxy-L-arabinose transferase-like glycosyltransferase
LRVEPCIGIAGAAGTATGLLRAAGAERAALNVPRWAATPVAARRLGIACWCALLLPLAILLPPIPIDETRYLTAAWEMFNYGQWLVPTVNGAWYSDKSPLLFWLIAGGWKVVGVHTWVARVETLAIAVAIVVTLRRVAQRLGMDARGAETAMWLLAGCAGFAVFATAIMFDLLLTLCVLAALHGLLDLDRGKWKRGVGVLGTALGLGILAKGPVMLLHVLPVAVLAPAWSGAARAHMARWYVALATGLLIGIAIALAWLLPAAWYAGPGYWQPLVDKVSGRLARSFAHSRPFWWYLPLVPLLLLPWLLALRAPRAAWAVVWRGRFGRFATCWWVVPFVGFSAISGKQIHYLLPLLPAWALMGAWLLQQRGARLRPTLFVVLALAVAAALAWLPFRAASTFGWTARPALAWFALLPIVVAAGAWRAWGHDPKGLALSATALAATAMLAGALAFRPALDVAPEAAFVKQELIAHVPITHVGWHNGLFAYTGRLRQPLPWIPHAAVRAWCRTHPDGILLTSNSHLAPPGISPYRAWPYALSGDHRIAAWRAADVLATGASQ